MKSLLIAISFSFLAFSANAQPKDSMTAREYSSYLTEITNNIRTQGTKWGKQFSIIKSGSKTFPYLKPFRTDLTDYITKKREEIKKVPAVGKDGEGFKKVILDFMDFESGMVNKSFLPFESYTAKTSDKEINNALQNLIKVGGTEKEVLKKVKATQQAYAKANGFTIK